VILFGGLKVKGSISAFYYTNIRSITQKINDPSVFKLDIWDDLGYPASGMVLG